MSLKNLRRKLPSALALAAALAGVTAVTWPWTSDSALHALGTVLPSVVDCEVEAIGEPVVQTVRVCYTMPVEVTPAMVGDTMAGPVQDDRQQYLCMTTDDLNSRVVDALEKELGWRPFTDGNYRIVPPPLSHTYSESEAAKNVGAILSVDRITQPVRYRRQLRWARQWRTDWTEADVSAPVGLPRVEFASADSMEEFVSLETNTQLITTQADRG